MKKRIKIGLPAFNSRLHDAVVESLEIDLDPNQKTLVYESTDVQLFLMRGWDIPHVVELNWLDVAICGIDCVQESRANVLVIESLGVRESRIVVAKRAGHAVDHQLGVCVVTEYPNLASEYFSKRGIGVSRLTTVTGAAEAYACLDKVDYIVDLTTTGATLRANGLEILDTLLVTNACVIRPSGPNNPLSPILDFGSLKESLSGFRNEI